MKSTKEVVYVAVLRGKSKVDADGLFNMKAQYLDTIKDNFAGCWTLHRARFGDPEALSEHYPSTSAVGNVRAPR